MNRKQIVFTVAVVAVIGLLLVAGAAQAQPEVIFEGNVAYGIRNLEVEGLLYNVEFRDASTLDVFGDPPQFDFPTDASALAAAQAARDALNTVPEVEFVGPPGGTVLPQFNVPYAEEEIEILGNLFRLAVSREVTYVVDPELGADWVENLDPDVRLVNDPTSIAKFTLVSSTEDPVTIGGTVTGLEGSGLVLQNNGGDDLPIDADGPFTFATSLPPGSFYNVTVATQPTSPAQFCSVENGSGQVPAEAVTDVAVTCGEAPEATVSTVAKEGDTLPDGTLLKEIILQGGVAINLSGKVAFGGRNEGGIDAAFTQDGQVAAEGDTLPDGSILATFRDEGEVAIGASQSGDILAFHGQDDANTDSVFTQEGIVAAESQTLPDGTLIEEIDDTGKVAVNDFGEVAFHGKIEIGDDLLDRETFRAVFTSLGLAAREATTLPDGATIEEINENGGVSINEFGEVAFHGFVVNPDGGFDSLKAVFTSAGLVVREGDTLPDGTLLDDIEVNGGVDMNVFGEAAFHGDVIAPAAGSDAVKAVLTQEGVVVREGDTLPDGTIVDEINVNAGVGINFFSDVVFQGRTGDIKAVFTQDGLVAKEGDTLADGTVLNGISDSAGVAINFFGQVAFHGLAGSVDAVLVGQLPEDGDDAAPPDDGDEPPSE